MKTNFRVYTHSLDLSPVQQLLPTMHLGAETRPPRCETCGRDQIPDVSSLPVINRSKPQ